MNINEFNQFLNTPRAPISESTNSAIAPAKNGVNWAAVLLAGIAAIAIAYAYQLHTENKKLKLRFKE
jgi:hypothetical protein